QSDAARPGVRSRLCAEQCARDAGEVRGFDELWFRRPERGDCDEQFRGIAIRKWSAPLARSASTQARLQTPPGRLPVLAPGHPPAESKKADDRLFPHRR